MMRATVWFILSLVLFWIAFMILLISLASLSKAEDRISVLTLNIAGLPSAFTEQDRPEKRMAAIANQSNYWDIVVYQEDFYHTHYLRNHSTFTHRIEGVSQHNFGYIWSWLSKSGLTFQTNWEVLSSGFQAFSECHGYLRYSNDCWVPKGILCNRVLSPTNIIIDVCTTHFDAGQSSGDQRARSTQIKEYLDFLPEAPKDLPWLRIEAGDYNLYPDSPEVQGLFQGRRILSQDSQREKTVDYIVVETQDLELEIEFVGRVPVFDGLSDHPAVGTILHLREIHTRPRVLY